MKHRFFSAANERFRAEVRAFVERDVRPRVKRWERDRKFPLAVIDNCRRRGYLALDPWRNAVLAEELPRCESLGVALNVLVQSNLVGPLLEKFEVNIEGVGAMAVTEPSAGSDFTAMKTTANDRHLLN